MNLAVALPIFFSLLTPIVANETMYVFMVTSKTLDITIQHHNNTIPFKIELQHREDFELILANRTDEKTVTITLKHDQIGNRKITMPLKWKGEAQTFFYKSAFVFIHYQFQCPMGSTLDICQNAPKAAENEDDVWEDIRNDKKKLTLLCDYSSEDPDAVKVTPAPVAVKIQKRILHIKVESSSWLTFETFRPYLEIALVPILAVLSIWVLLKFIGLVAYGIREIKRYRRFRHPV